MNQLPTDLCADCGHERFGHHATMPFQCKTWLNMVECGCPAFDAGVVSTTGAAEDAARDRKGDDAISGIQHAAANVRQYRALGLTSAARDEVSILRAFVDALAGSLT